ncbi:MAG: hypothetical protein AAFV53_15845 [Myxococcota bacterium]
MSVLWLLAALGCRAAPAVSDAESAADTGSVTEEDADTRADDRTLEEVTVSLVDASSWVEVDASLDPFSDRPADVSCTALGYGPELDTFEVQTADCAYGTFRQPLLFDVRAGEEIVVVYWFLELFSTDLDAEGHVALAVDDGLLFEDHIPIPGGPETRQRTVTAPRDLVAGEWLYFHVHNHGFNSWYLGIVQADAWM